MKKNVFMMMAVAGILFSSCASKKQLANCQDENKSLTASLQTAKEDLAAKNARLASLEEQLAAQKRALAESKKAYDKLQGALDKSLTNASQNNISIEKLVDQIFFTCATSKEQTGHDSHHQNILFHIPIIKLDFFAQSAYFQLQI